MSHNLQGTYVRSFHAAGSFHLLRHDPATHTYYLYAANDTTMLLEGTTVFTSLADIAIQAVSYQNGVYTLGGSITGSLFDVFSEPWRNEKEAVVVSLPKGQNLLYEPSQRVEILAVSTTAIEQETFEIASGIYTTSVYVSDARVTIKNWGPDTLHSLYINSVMSLESTGPIFFCAHNFVERQRYNTLSLAPGEEIVLAFGDLNFSMQNNGSTVCFSLSNLNQAPGFYVCLVQLRDGRQLSQRFVYR